MSVLTDWFGGPSLVESLGYDPREGQQWTYTPVPVAPWVCPKCGRVWAGGMPNCMPCNAKIDAAEQAEKDHS